MQNHGFHRALMRSDIAMKYNREIPFVNHMTDVLQIQGEFCGKDDITIPPEEGCTS